MATTDQRIENSLPAAIDVERVVLGSILLDNAKYYELSPFSGEEFSLESQRAADLITVSEELRRQQQLESIGGVAYLASLTDGIVSRTSIVHYVNIVRDKYLARKLIEIANRAMLRAYEQSDPVGDILGSTEEEVMKLSEDSATRDFSGIPEIVRDSFGSVDELWQRGKRVTGLETHYQDLDELTSGFQK